MDFDVIIVGGGMAGLTAAAFLSKAGRSVLVCEKEDILGGLVSSFERDGFVYDGGIRAMENSGIVLPMLRKLGLEVEFLPNPIAVGIEDRVIRIRDEQQSLADYHALLAGLYPEAAGEIDAIMEQVRQITHYMNVQYGIDNPFFLDVREDRDYFIRTVLPWMFKYALTAPRIKPYDMPVLDFLRRYTDNQSLLDIITQHFFQATPAFFALSYTKLYLEYAYPRGGTGSLVKKMETFIREHGGALQTSTTITAVDPVRRQVTDAHGRTHGYRRLIWAADMKTFYRAIDPETISDERVRSAFLARRELIADKIGNDSVLTLFLGVNLPPAYLAERASAHFFYTASRTGQSAAGPLPMQGDRPAIEAWLKDFFALTTYEISIPVLRDEGLAPPGKTGLVISVLFDYHLTERVRQQGWYDPFKTFVEDCILDTLDASAFPGLRQAILQRFSSTPLTMARLAGTTHGAITGWSFTNSPLPAESRLTKMLGAVRSPIPGILQAGQWTYSPSGLPIAILTGKLAADEALKGLKKGR